MNITRDTRLGGPYSNRLPNKIRLVIPSFRKILLHAEAEEGIVYDEDELLHILIDLVSVDAKAREKLEYYVLQLALDQPLHILDNINSTLSLIMRLGELLQDSFRNHGLYQNGKLDYLFHTMHYGAIIIQDRASFYKELSIELGT